MKKIFFIITLSVLMASTLTSISAYATDLTIYSGVQSAKGIGVATDLFGYNGIFATVSNTLLFVIGALSVLMIVIGGLRYVISGGNSNAVTSAKNTILYAIVGLVIAFLAYAVINFVLNALAGGGGTNV